MDSIGKQMSDPDFLKAVAEESFISEVVEQLYAAINSKSLDKTLNKRFTMFMLEDPQMTIRDLAGLAYALGLKASVTLTPIKE